MVNTLFLPSASVLNIKNTRFSGVHFFALYAFNDDYSRKKINYLNHLIYKRLSLNYFEVLVSLEIYEIRKPSYILFLKGTSLSPPSNHVFLWVLSYSLEKNLVVSLNYFRLFIKLKRKGTYFLLPRKYFTIFHWQK